MIRRRAVTPAALGCGVVGAVVCFYFGADAWWSLVIGLAVAVAALGVPGGRGDEGRQPRAGRRVVVDRAGARWDVAELAWSFRSRFRRVGPTAVDRLRALARGRLAGRGLDLRDVADRPAIEALVGRGVYQVLTAARRTGPTVGSYLRCLDAIDRLIPGPPSPVRSSRRSPHV